MSDIISESIGDPTDSDPDFPANPETGQPTSEAEGPADAGTDDGLEPEEFASPTV